MAIPTPGYEPYRVLYHLFHQNGHFDECALFREPPPVKFSGCKHPLTAEQLEEIKGLFATITRKRGFEEGTSLLGRFMGRMEPRRLSIGEADLVDGLLECLNPYQDGEPFTTFQTHGGIYDHFKGGIYKVNGFGSWASGDGELTVHYTSMIHGTDHFRLVEQWCEVVQWPDKKFRSRFVYRGPDLKTPAPEYKVPSPVV